MSISEDKGDNLEQIYAWLDEIPLSRPKKNTARDFSDGVLMAEVLKTYYPRLVDVHNYFPGNSIAKKLDNWCTLNRKVLSKIDMKLSKELIERLANSQPGAIEKVLIDLRIRILKDCNFDNEILSNESEEKGKGESAKNDLNHEMLANKTVPCHLFTRLKQELREKKDIINILNEKVSQLETLMKIKDQKIYDLTAQIMSPTDRTRTPSSLALGTGVFKQRKKNV